MASTISTYLQNKILDKTLRNTDYTVATVYVSLHTANPGEAGASEVTGGSYARQSASFDAATGDPGVGDNTANIVFASMPAATVTAVGLWDASTAGNFLWGGDLTASKPVSAGYTFQINAGALDVQLD